MLVCAAGNPSVSLAADSFPYTGELYLLRQSRWSAKCPSTVNQDGRKEGAKPPIRKKRTGKCLCAVAFLNQKAFLIISSSWFFDW